ncbi:MAG: winged helix-turn-helix transcriptional regulator [Betaproteobacteria bacterium]|nr:winged helix-turn-helix transcriptional regulator [Betaproteobacteria bacterium]
MAIKRPASAGRGTGASAKGGATDGLDPVLGVVARYFGVLAEPTRLKILHAICDDEQSVSAIVAATGTTQSNVSRHLSLMLNAGIVERRRDGCAVYYRIADPEFVDICRRMCERIASRLDMQAPLRRDLMGFAARH